MLREWPALRSLHCRLFLAFPGHVLGVGTDWQSDRQKQQHRPFSLGASSCGPGAEVAHGQCSSAQEESGSGKSHSLIALGAFSGSHTSRAQTSASLYRTASLSKINSEGSPLAQVQLVIFSLQRSQYQIPSSLHFLSRFCVSPVFRGVRPERFQEASVVGVWQLMVTCNEAGRRRKRVCQKVSRSLLGW